MNQTIACLSLAACAALGGCAADNFAQTNFTRAQAALQPTRGNSAHGTIYFVQGGGVVKVTGEVHGLVPGSVHGFHVHERGDCSSGDGMSTGGHFNPSGTPHGQAGHGPHHAGDLQSIKAGPGGTAKIEFEAPSVTLTGAQNGIVGKGLIVHRDPDDYTTQPTGNSGPRIACGVVVRTM